MDAKKKYYIEKLRETWNLKGCKEIVIDSYPGMQEYIEVDCHTETCLFKAVKKLGLKYDGKKLPNVSDIYYDQYNISKKEKHMSILLLKMPIRYFGNMLKKIKNNLMKF